MTRLLLAAAVAAVLSGPASARDFPFGLFKKKAKAEPTAGRAKQISATLVGSPDESARKQAAEELRALDPRSNAEVFPALIGALQKDPSPAVRVAAADSVGKLKPVYQPAGMVLEAVAKSDPDPAVREAAQNALFQYHLGGYTTPVGPRGVATPEPPVAVKPTAPGAFLFRPITNVLGRGSVTQPTAEPPLAKKPAAEAAKPIPPAIPRQMPATLPPPEPAPLPSVSAPSVPSGPLPPISVPIPPG